MATRPECDIVSELTARGESLSVTESLTGGLVASAIVSVPGASAVFRGGVVAYQKSVKAHLLGVDPELLAQGGAVSEAVVCDMADGVRGALEDSSRATWGLATTGIAGPDPDPDTGALPGEVWIGVSGPRGTRAWHFSLAGDREAIRSEATRRALEALAGEVMASGE